MYQVRPVELKRASMLCDLWHAVVCPNNKDPLPASPAQPERIPTQNMPVGHMIKFIITYQTVSNRQITNPKCSNVMMLLKEKKNDKMIFIFTSNSFK